MKKENIKKHIEDDADRHVYEYPVDLNENSAAANVVRMVGSNRQVLEIGAGPGSITKILKGHGGCSITALELDSTAIQKLAPYCEKVYQADLNDASWPQLLPQNETYEVIVAADVLEHLYDPWLTLDKINSLLSKDGYAVVSLPHVSHSAVVACLLNEDFSYQDWGLLDKTHIRFFGIKNIQHLFNQSGMKIVDAQFVIIAPEDTEFAKQWHNLSEEVKSALASNPFSNVYQVVVKAVSQSSLEEEVILMSLFDDFSSELSVSDVKSDSAVKRAVRAVTSLRMRKGIRKVARKIGLRSL